MMTFLTEMFSKSAAHERELERRYEYIRAGLDVTRAGVELAKIDNEGFQNLVAQIDGLNVVVGADWKLPDSAALVHPRLGTTLVLPKRRPLIWLNLVKHRGNVAALVDTVAHEAIHATVVMLKRNPRTPQPEEEIAYHAEEIVAFTGANHILAEINFPAKQQIAQNLAAVQHHTTILTKLGCTEAFVLKKIAEGAVAKAFFTEHLIRCPRRPRGYNRSE